MASLQTLQHKLASLQGQYDLTANKFKALSQRRAIETDVSERFKLDEEIKQAEADLDRLGQQVDELDQKIRAIESGQMKLDDVLQQEGLQSAGKVASGRNLIALAAVAVLGLGGVGVLMSRSNPGPQSSTSTASSPQATPQPSPTQSGLDSRFAGTWTTEGDVQPTHSMNLVLKNPQKDKVEGVLQTAQRRGAGATSGYVTVVGRGQDSVADVILYNQRGNAIGNAQLRLEEQNLVWRLDAGSNEIFPIKATLHK